MKSLLMYKISLSLDILDLVNKAIYRITAINGENQLIFYGIIKVMT